jgi:predicted outer membrane lipoprotein
MFSEKHQRENATSDLIAGALIALSIIIMQDFISTGITGILTFISMSAIAIELPFLAFCLLVDFHERIYKKRTGPKNTRLYNVLYGFGILFGFIAIDTTFWHISWIIGTILLLCSLIAFIAMIVHHREISKQDSEEDSKKQGEKPMIIAGKEDKTSPT